MTTLWSSLEFVMTPSTDITIFSLVMLQLLAFVSSTFDHWSHVHYLRNHSTFNLFYLWCESAIIVACLYFVLIRTQKTTFRAELSRMHYLLPLLILHSFASITLVTDSFNEIRTNSAGTEVKQLAIMLTLPVMICLVDCLFTELLSARLRYGLTVACGMQILLLARDEELAISFVSVIKSTLIALSTALSLLIQRSLLNGRLRVNISLRISVVGMMFYLSLFQLFLLPIVSIIQGDRPRVIMPVLKLFVVDRAIVFMVSSKILGLLSTLLLVQHAHPFVSMVTLNFSWLPIYLIQTFGYKRELHVSSFVASLLLAPQLIAVVFATRKKRSLSSTARARQQGFFVEHGSKAEHRILPSLMSSFDEADDDNGLYARMGSI